MKVSPFVKYIEYVFFTWIDYFAPPSHPIHSSSSSLSGEKGHFLLDPFFWLLTALIVSYALERKSIKNRKVWKTKSFDMCEQWAMTTSGFISQRMFLFPVSLSAFDRHQWTYKKVKAKKGRLISTKCRKKKLIWKEVSLENNGIMEIFTIQDFALTRISMLYDSKNSRIALSHISILRCNFNLCSTTKT